MHEIDSEEKETSLCRRQKFAQTEQRTHQTLDNQAPQCLGIRLTRSHILGFSLFQHINNKQCKYTSTRTKRMRNESWPSGK